jgi:hypothetical protein
MPGQRSRVVGMICVIPSALSRRAHGECPFGSVQFKQTNIDGTPELRAWDDKNNNVTSSKQWTSLEVSSDYCLCWPPVSHVTCRDFGVPSFMQNQRSSDGAVSAVEFEGNCRLFPSPWNTGKGIGFPVTCKSCVCALQSCPEIEEDGRFCSTLQVSGESVDDEEWNGTWERYTSFPIASESDDQAGNGKIFSSLRAEFTYLCKPIYHHQGKTNPNDATGWFLYWTAEDVNFKNFGWAMGPDPNGYSGFLPSDTSVYDPSRAPSNSVWKIYACEQPDPVNEGCRWTTDRGITITCVNVTIRQDYNYADEEGSSDYDDGNIRTVSF